MNSLDYLLSFQKFGIKLGLDNIEHLLGRLGNPHHDFPAIHIAGTNGKGSVLAFIHSALTTMGYRVGRYTSPHLVDFSERIVVNDTPVNEKEIAELVESIRPIVDEMESDSRWGHPTFFEAVTAMAFQHFSRRKVDFAIVEVGMGGRYDSTNVVKSCLTIINNVSMEHQDYLGDTIEKIATEKAGVIKSRIEIVSAAEDPDVKAILDAKAEECGSKIYYLSRDFHCERRTDTYPRQWLDYKSPWATLHDVEINLAGRFQAKNASVALMALELLQRKQLISFDEATLRDGIAKTEWPARLEKLSDSPPLFLDVAHNPAAADFLVDAMLELFPDNRVVLVVGMLSDKDVETCLRTLRRLGDTIVVTQPGYERALPAEKLAESAKSLFEHVLCERSIASAIQAALELASRDDIILIAGSLFNVAEVRAFVASMQG